MVFETPRTLGFGGSCASFTNLDLRQAGPGSVTGLDVFASGYRNRSPLQHHKWRADLTRQQCIAVGICQCGTRLDPGCTAAHSWGRLSPTDEWRACGYNTASATPFYRSYGRAPTHDHIKDQPGWVPTVQPSTP
ncbi:hypothetical protein CH63R_07874 [Colletotrichum higginsianum IMI 349063]|uniref:Uncharacterized protein n=1 Tax=Colletotrichum higginsianum (strain IMI 349063) TaxID=759273 RepID=A0A1B7YAQ8_COLHI|nr:hypothetical protein CH63R_07874 [Colletotrichum higginsianum IMI 349063]OBR09109.1 hypothetical protein CH63R_07874 [Colletotrichum higginsianum IMI 349063]